MMVAVRATMVRGAPGSGRNRWKTCLPQPRPPGERPQPRQFVQAGRLVAAWDTGISAAGTVSRTAITADQFFVLVTPDPTAGFGEFAFYPHELRSVEVAQ